MSIELKKRKKFDIKLLNQLIIRDNAILLGDYNILTQHSTIKYKCKCGTNYSKKFKNIFDYGGAFCMKCSNNIAIQKRLLTYKSINKEKIYENISKKNRLSVNELNNRLKNNYKDIDILNINEYKHISNKLNFKCNICNLEFTRNIRSTIINGCPTCKAKMIKLNITSTIIYSDTSEKRRENFIKNLEKLHPNLYDYSNMKYINKNTKINLKCLKCKKDFDILPCQLLNKNKKHIVGCQKCNIEQKIHDRCIPINEIKEKIKDKWVVNDWTNYNNQKNIVTAYCIKCNYENKQMIKQLIQAGCSKCYNNKRGNSQRLNNNTIIERFKNIWNNTYDYSKVEYKNIFNPVTIICKNHEEFKLVPQLHIRGSGCPKCFTTTELYLLEILKKYYPSILTQFKLDSCKNKKYLPFDYCIPEIKTIIELDGGQHFNIVKIWKSSHQQLERDIYKMNLAHKEGYKIIRLTQMDVFKYKEKWIIDNLLPEINNKDDRNHIFISTDDTIYDKHIELFNKL